MSQTDTGAWWTEVEHLRERIERRREMEVSYAASRARRSGAEADTAAQRRPAHASTAADLPGPAPRRTVNIRGRATAAIAVPRLRPAPDERFERQPEPAPARDEDDRNDAWGGAYGARRRPRRSLSETLGRRPDRMALWAFALALLTLLIALLSSH